MTHIIPHLDTMDSFLTKNGKNDMQVDVDLDVSCNYVQSEFMVRVFLLHLELLGFNWIKKNLYNHYLSHYKLLGEFLDCVLKLC